MNFVSDRMEGYGQSLIYSFSSYIPSEVIRFGRHQSLPPLISRLEVLSHSSLRPQVDSVIIRPLMLRLKGI